MKPLQYGLLIVALAVATSAFAQYPGMGEGGWGGHRGTGQHEGRRMPTVDDQVKHLTKQLKLDDNQQTQVRSILQDQQDKMQQLRSDQSSSREDRMAKMKQIHQDSVSKIREILNDNQKKEYETLLQKQQENRQRWGGRESSEQQ